MDPARGPYMTMPISAQNVTRETLHNLREKSKSPFHFTKCNFEGVDLSGINLHNLKFKKLFSPIA
ncbi:MAG: hypothetical protein LEGION0403_FIIPPAGN_00898 [Legionella sp.]